MKQIIKSSFLIVIISFQLTAQVNQDYYNPATLANYIPPSPDAAELGKYAEIPVNYSTGIPEIYIPLFNIKTGTINLPLSLSYHSSGVKVEEEASWVGLGWSLNAGGLITRVVKGIPDDQFSVYCTDYNSQTGYGGDYYADNAGYFYCSNLINELYDGTSGNQLELRDKIALGQLDGDPDIFYFNFGGYSGSFVFDKDRIPHLTSDSDLNISFEQKDENGILSTTGLITSFTIIATDGTKFFFEEVEFSRVFPGSSHGDISPEQAPDPYNFVFATFWEDEWLSYNSSWYITKIEDASGVNEVTFSYNTFSSFNISNLSQKSFYGQDHSTSHMYRFIDTWSNSMTATYVKKLSRIDWDNGYITFDANYARVDTRRCINCIDLPEPSVTISAALTDINIFNSNQLLINKYHLIYSNFISNGASTAPPGKKYGYYRLKLDAIEESNASSALPPYQFFYNTSAIFPHRLSCEQDFWGHYNGNEATNGQLIPNIYVYPDCDVSTSIYKSIYSVFQRNNSETEYLILGTNRNSNIYYAKAGILNKMIYPLGGSETFTYELNKFKVDNNTIEGCGLRVYEIKTQDSEADSSPKIRNFTYINSNGSTSGIVLSIPEFAYYNYIIDPEYHDDDHTIEEQQVYHAVRFSTTQTGFGANQSNRVNYQNVSVENPGNGKTIYEYFFPVQFGVENVSIDGDLIYERTIGSSLSNFPFAPNPNYNFMNGKLKSETVFNNTMKIKDVLFEYEIKSFDRIKAYTSKVKRNDYIFGPNGDRSFIISTGSKYYTISAWNTLRKKTITEYFDNGQSELPIITEYYYDSPSHKMLTQKTETRSDGLLNKTTYEYPPDVIPNEVFTSQAVLDAMVTKNTISPVMKSDLYNGVKLIDGSITSYDYFNTSNISPKASYELMGDTYQNTYNFDDYNNEGNILQLHKENDLITSYYWSFNDQYPIVKAINSTYVDLANEINTLQPDIETFMTGLGDLSNESNRVALKHFITSLQEALTDAQIFVYTYIPLTGTTSETTPNGITTIYQYDEFNRLETIRDFDYNVLKHLDYNYIFTANVINNTSYIHGDIRTFTVAIHGGSGNFSYNWDLSCNGQIVATSTGKTLTSQLTESGGYSINCIVTDNETGFAVNTTGNFYVTPINCTYLDIIQTNNISSATLQSPFNEVVTLKVTCSGNMHLIYINVDNNTYHNISNGMTIEVPFDQNRLSFVSIDGEGTNINVKLDIQSVQNNSTNITSPYTLEYNK